MTATPLSAEELRLIDGWWRACNYLSVGMIYLRDNPLLQEPLKIEHVKLRLLGHWGASPALSFVWAHLNRMIVKHDLDMIFQRTEECSTNEEVHEEQEHGSRRVQAR